MSHTAVQRAIADGRLTRSLLLEPGRPPQLLPTLADVEWEAHTSPAHARGQESLSQAVTRTAPPLFPPSQPERRGPTVDDYRRSLVLEKVVKTKLAQVRLDEQQGRLIDATDAGMAQFEIARLVRNQLQELPDRLADELALEGDAHRVRAILAREIDDVLRKLARRLDPSIAVQVAAPPSSSNPRPNAVTPTSPSTPSPTPSSPAPATPRSPRDAAKTSPSVSPSPPTSPRSRLVLRPKSPAPTATPSPIPNAERTGGGRA